MSQKSRYIAWHFNHNLSCKLGNAKVVVSPDKVELLMLYYIKRLGVPYKKEWTVILDKTPQGGTHIQLSGGYRVCETLRSVLRDLTEVRGCFKKSGITYINNQPWGGGERMKIE